MDEVSSRYEMSNSKPIISVKDLSVSFGRTKVVDGVGFDLKPGQTLGIVGESGSGKSMTALSLLRLLPEAATMDAAGIIFYRDGEAIDWSTLSESEMRSFRGKHIGLVFQEPFSALNPTMRCGTQIKEAVDIHLKLSAKEARKYILGLLQRVGIHDPERIYSSYPHQLSGGQMQRVLIALAVSCKPDILIADEPTTALDVTVQKNVLKLFKDLQNEYGCALIFISHDLGVIKEIADDVLVMKDGQIVEKGRVEEIFNSPKEAYTKGLIACRPPLEKKLNKLPTVTGYLDGDPADIKEISLDEQKARLDLLLAQETILRSQGLTVRYPGDKTWWGGVRSYTEAVAPIDIKIFPGETLGLVGESGSGKSSLGRAILKLNPYAQGEIYFNGQRIDDLTPGQMRPLRKKIQIIFQDPYSTLNPKMKVGKAIQEVLYVHGIGGSRSERRDRAVELLEKCGMKADHYERYPHEFSGGQRQRISIARTLAVSPEFIVCDESVSALDVSVQAQILNLLKDLQEEMNLTYLFISHDLSVVKHMSDRIMVMKEGQIVEEGTPEDIFSSPQTDYTRELIRSIPGYKDFFVR
jgi:peptide/nickel transport system ATP-binding protein